MFFVLLFVLTDAFTIHGFGLGKCDSKEVPTVKFPDDFVLETFYTFKLGEDGIAGASGIYVDDTHAYIPTAVQHTGYYTRKSVALSEEQSGVVELFWYRNQASSLSAISSSPILCGSSESLMPIEQSGIYTQADLEAALGVKAQMEKFNYGEECLASDEGSYSLEREKLINEYMILTRVPAQSVAAIGEPLQREAVDAEPLNLPNNMEYRKTIANALADKTLPLHDSEHNMMSLGCLHFPAGECHFSEIKEQNYMVLELNKKLESYGGIAQFTPVGAYNTIMASTYVQYNEYLNQLEFTVVAHNMFRSDPDSLGNFESTNFMGKPNVEVMHQNPITMKDVAPLCPKQMIAAKLPDFQQFQLWLPLEEVCPEDVQEEFRQALKALDVTIFNGAPQPPAGMTPEEIAAMMEEIKQRTIASALSLASIAATYHGCANRYFQSWIPHSHGYGVLQATVMLHAMMEIPTDML